MKDATASIHSDEPLGVDRQASADGHAHAPYGSGVPETFEQGSELSDRLSVWNLWFHDQEVARCGKGSNDYVAVISHELRNSLSAIRTATGVLSLDISAGVITVKARVLIERQIKQMSRLVEDIVDNSRVRVGQLALQCERVDLCAIVTRALQTVEFTMVMHSHNLTASFPDDGPVWLQADAVRLEEVLVNLLLNAAKYTAPGGDIQLRLEREDGEAVVRIRDTGIGIEPGDLPHVFDLFFRADRGARPAEPGLGVGLALVRSLVERHGGRVIAESAGLGQGCEFTVRLPTTA